MMIAVVLNVVVAVVAARPRFKTIRKFVPTTRRLDDVSCEYGYEEGKDPFGEDCPECYAPDNWGNCSLWTECNGNFQTPVDVVTADAMVPSAGMNYLTYDYEALSGLEIINTGHNLEVIGGFGTLLLNGIYYEAAQFHFHLLSEHTIDGKYFDGEMHIVHVGLDEDSQLIGYAVVGIMFQIGGDDNPFLDSIKWEEAPTTETGEGMGTTLDGDVDLNYFSEVLSGEYYRYKGGLTTPPCTELVEWHLMKTVVNMSQSQYDYFEAIFPNPSNYRPIMPMNGRNLLDTAQALSTNESCVVGADLCGEGLDCSDGVCTSETSEDCSYGYEDGKDPFGADCDDCLAPDDWGTCYADCDGDYQSPIDIVTADAMSSLVLGTTQIPWTYVPVENRTIINTGHNLEVLLDLEQSGYVTLRGTRFYALQFHFHLLSEHTIDGEYYDGEMHIVHAALDPESGTIDSLLVIGIMFAIGGDDNAFLESIKFEEAPTGEDHVGVMLDQPVNLTYFSDILDGDYYRYKGSLTTPACAEIVEWFVMKTPSTISQSQYDYFQAIFPNPANYRPTLPMNGRNLLFNSMVLGQGEDCVSGADLCGPDLVCTAGVCSLEAGCTDSTTWYKRGDPSKDCAWVADYVPRCDARGEDGGLVTYAEYSCPAACGGTCSDSTSWYLKSSSSKTCAWVAVYPEVRCTRMGADGMNASDACPTACA
ncbi:hypothetical protein CTAYLR_002678 [Chrysophaeum taylorii]|uniref:Carbonic anhydrase n=1 Tax=Chrysophaeum taylorii TaxID=2483200 RepID=A0AAD7UCH0_9STRA|nr:hypothetical protein CTAYLR_002678 [Chrysophaeum taylorii]